MITAIPVTKEHISGHFTKAESFIFINAEGRIVCHHINPAREGGCAEKKALLNMLQRQNAQRVIVRHIGERMLESCSLANCLSSRPTVEISTFRHCVPRIWRGLRR